MKYTIEQAKTIIGAKAWIVDVQDMEYASRDKQIIAGLLQIIESIE